MTSNQKTIQNLNKALQMEMSAAHQYQLHAHVLEDWGLGKLARQMRQEMQEELGHSDRFIERLMFLKGDPEIAFEKPPARATSLVDMFKADLADEEGAIAFYTEAARMAGDAGDIGSRSLFEGIVLDEEGHKAWLELQLDLIERIGEQNYASKQLSTEEGEGE
ncbi:bacterioferritin [Cribrihabitans marinus]|uniref:Bacterioferritin n=1 Tax=Cribrihabitans marinus TaxID=1227549 RepID=A0A1H6Z1X4_9RHOB|nr:bacterioferritin [Cribrihabitans marinus]GGH31497.1 bacterioferritin [Cribrihabitans marinus]SEJ47471.1 bacterioferritin [Cribrihabitans marinus]